MYIYIYIAAQQGEKKGRRATPTPCSSQSSPPSSSSSSFSLFRLALHRPDIVRLNFMPRNPFPWSIEESSVLDGREEGTKGESVPEPGRELSTFVRLTLSSFLVAALEVLLSRLPPDSVRSRIFCSLSRLELLPCRRRSPRS